MRQRWYVIAIAGVVMAAGSPAHAQRASENAVNAAEDAFGISLGNETVGLYSSSSARGFNPALAGNIRLDGLYFDQPNTAMGRTYAGTTMRVGLSAQSYPFPAPTGIADTRLRRPGDHLTTSGSLTFGPYDSVQLETEVAAPLVPGKLSASASLMGNSAKFDARADYWTTVYGALLNWTPNDAINIAVFDQGHIAEGQLPPLIFTASGAPPPEYDRSVYLGQTWAKRRRTTNNLGFVLSATLFDDWLLRTGLFRSDQYLPVEYATLYRNVQADGTGTVDLLRTAQIKDLSYSGEVRLTRAFNEGQRRHTLHIAVRGRDAEHRFGGGDSFSLGPAKVGVHEPRPGPTYPTPPATSLNHVSQITPGISYVGRWLDVGEFSVGVQKSIFQSKLTLPGFAPAHTDSSPWLYNSTLAVYLSKNAALYGSYTRGLEESGIAPETANNRGEALPVSLTEQIDAGIRYRLWSGLTLIAGVFEVRKPFFDRNAANFFTEVGNLSHRGIELSLSGQLAPGLTVVAGAMILRARIEANAAVASFIGTLPVGRPNRNVRLNVQYGPSSWHGLSVDGQINQDGPAFANRANTQRLNANTTLDLGARYVFKMRDTSASVRVRVLNATDAYGWNVSASGSYAPIPARRFTAQLVADF